MVKLVNNSGQYKLTIPKDIVISKKWSSKTRIRFIESVDGSVYLKSVDGRGVKIVDNSGQYKITVPVDLVDDKKWSGKTKIRFVEDLEGNIILKEIK